MQEIVLGVGGVRMLRALGYNPSVWHMNEGHAAFLTIERARELVAAGHTLQRRSIRPADKTSLPRIPRVPAGNDEFPLWLIDKYFSALLAAVENQPRAILRYCPPPYAVR